MRKRPLPTREQLDRIFDIKIDTGEIFLKHQSGKGHLRSRNGKRAGWIKQRRRGGKERIIEFFLYEGIKTSIREHWIIWFYATEHWPDFPKETIDHVNCDALDNRFSNLRIASQSQQNHNTKLKRSNKIGLKWVYKHGKNFGIRVNGFKTAEEAHEAACLAAQRIHGKFYRPK